MPLAYSYVRFSTAKQMLGHSLERQVSLTLSYCQRKGLELDESLTLQDLGVSAFKGDNVREGALAAFLDACRSGRVPRGSYLVVESLDRLSRDQIRPALQLFLGLQDYGVTIVTLQPEREYRPDNTDALSLIEPLIVFARSHEESLMKSHRMRSSWGHKWGVARAMSRRVSSRCPAWLEPDGDSFRVVEEKAAVVRRIFRMVTEGMSCGRVAQVLNDEGVATIATARRWAPWYVQRVLGPPAKGCYQPRHRDGYNRPLAGEPIPGYYPAVVTEAEWEAAQAAVESRRTTQKAGRRGGDANLFTGLVYCARTKAKMALAYVGNGKNASHYKYLYARPSGGGLSGRTMLLPYKEFEEATLSFLWEMKPDDIKGAATPKDELASLFSQKTALDEKLRKTAERARRAEDFEVYLDLIESLQKERKAVAERIERASSPARPMENTKSLVEFLRAGGKPAREKAKLRLRGIVREIWVLGCGGERKTSPRWFHVQIHFRSGVFRTYTLFHKRLSPVSPLPAGTDLRDYRPDDNM
jgi:DNA invertase Pin-like site-specific DNA recombinase